MPISSGYRFVLNACTRLMAWSRPVTIAASCTRTGRSKARTDISSKRSKMHCCCRGKSLDQVIIDKIVAKLEQGRMP